MKTIFLAEGERHVLDSLRLMLEQRADMKIVGEARSVESLLAQVCRMATDVILLDWNLPGIYHPRLIRTLYKCCPGAIVIAISVKPEHEFTVKDYGLDGFISKQLSAECFMESLDRIMSGLEKEGES